MTAPTRRIASCIHISHRPTCHHTVKPSFAYRAFSNTKSCRINKKETDSFSTRLGKAWSKTKITWYTIPVGAGIAFLGLTQFYKVSQREKARNREELGDGNQDGQQPKKRKRVRPSGPWSVQIMSTLPLKAFSRLWGWFNELTIPYYLRVPGFKLYSYIFGVNLLEVEEPDLHNFPNLAAFFYRTLKPGARPLDPNLNAVLSPADGKVIQFGIIQQGEVEQVKGMTYTLDALLGAQTPLSSSGTVTPTSSYESESETIRSHEEFAKMNGLSYTLPSFLSGSSKSTASKTQPKTSSSSDQSTGHKASSAAEVRASLALSPGHWSLSPFDSTPTDLYYAVIYLAPGDYHRFHSPAAWVVERRRHFAGDLYSVSPYLQRTLPGLFTLNERVVLLGRWRWGFFSYTPVGATNVGSIVVNFDRELRTNRLTTDTLADRLADEAAARGDVFAGFVEASYALSSSLLGGHPLRRGEEMGGFQLGSTIVLVFEAPSLKKVASSDQGVGDSKDAVATIQSGFKWNVEKGQTIRMGQSLGEVIE